MITQAIPSFRMDKNGFEFEAMQLKEMGVIFKFNTSIGKDIEFGSLVEKFDSVIIATGLQQAKKLENIEKNIQSNKKADAITFLKHYNDNQALISKISTIVIIGGGNSAIDAARAAKKLNPLNNVIITCIESEENMPAFAEEINHAKVEEINFINSSFIKNIQELTNGKISVSLNNFENKNQHLLDLECDFVIIAIGQTGDRSINLSSKIVYDENGRIINSETKTEIKNVFIAGDVCAGNNMSLIGAIASGKKAAIEVRKLLENYKYNYEGDFALQRLNTDDKPEFKTNKSIVGLQNQELEKYDLFQSCQKCNHCIDNFGCPAMVKVNGKVQIDMSRCTMCGLCIDVCPNNAISWVTIEEEELENEVNI